MGCLHFCTFIIRNVALYRLSLFASLSSISRCRCIICLKAFSIFSFFFSSAFVPLHCFNAFDGILHPSTANISFPINSISSHTINTSGNSRTISSLAVKIKSAIANGGQVFHFDLFFNLLLINLLTVE